MKSEKRKAESGKAEKGAETAVSPAIASPLPACLKRCEVACLLQVSVWTVDRLVANGDIRVVRARRAVRFLRSEVEKFLNEKN